MRDINLLPWRAALLVRRTQRFGIVMVVAAGLAVAGVVAARLWAHGELAQAQSRLDGLHQELAMAQTQLDQRRDWQGQEAALARRLQMFTVLRNARIRLVHVFDALVRLLPDQTWYTTVSRQGDTLEIAGLANKEADIAVLMHGLETSPWFAGPVALQLQQPQVLPQPQTPAYRFQLRVQMAAAVEEQP